MKRHVCDMCNGEGVRWMLKGIPPREDIVICPRCRGNGYHYVGEPDDYYECNLKRKKDDSPTASESDPTAER